MVIIGGGCAGVAAAWQLSRNPRYEVSVYEQTGRLGGKGASRRASDGRILEHGLHVWLGFYENAFGMIRECYAEVERRQWGPGSPDARARLAHASFADAFSPEPHIGVFGKNAGDDVVWSGLLPPEEGLPGDPIVAGSNPFTLANYLLRCVHLLKTLIVSVVAQPSEDVPGRERPAARSPLDETLDLRFALGLTESPELFIANMAERVRAGTLTLAAALLQAVTTFESILQDFNHSPEVAGSTLNLMKALAGQARKQLRDVVAIDKRLRWKTEIIDIVMTIAIGLYRDRALFSSKGLDALNAFDYREWLLKHGATNTALESRFITGIYDLVFAYEDGNRNKPKLAAGVALRGALRMFFTYRGSMFWRMRSGMGDAVFAPLYRVLSSGRRDARSKETLPPVTFRFRHELSEVRFDAKDPTRPFVTELIFKDRSPDGDRAGEVLDHFGCWPAIDDAGDVRAGQAQQPARETSLKIGEDFDAVIFANGFHAFAEIVNGKKSKGLDSAAMPAAWRRAVQRERKETVATKAAQVWLGDDLEELGWHRGSGIVAGLGEAFQTWADMTHTLPSEKKWRQARQQAAQDDAQQPEGPTDNARSVAYFCGVLAEKDIAADGDPAALEKQLVAFLRTDMPRLWPEAQKPALLKLLATHVQANIAGSDRYSLSLPGAIERRLSPLDNSVRNATVAGDWTACGLDAGCIEAAVISGMLAAHAIDGTEPALDTIIGYDHP